MIEAVVGKEVYKVWIEMLNRLVPNGRTHRLSVLIGGMLQYAQEIAYEKSKTNSRARELYQSFESDFENYVDGNITELLALTESLLDDAKVTYKRISSRGSEYNIAEEAVYQFLHWEDMPWES